MGRTATRLHCSERPVAEYINDVPRSIDGMFFGRVAYGSSPAIGRARRRTSTSGEQIRSAAPCRRGALDEHAADIAVSTRWSGPHGATRTSFPVTSPPRSRTLDRSRSRPRSLRRRRPRDKRAKTSPIDEYRLVINPVLPAGKRLSITGRSAQSKARRTRRSNRARYAASHRRADSDSRQMPRAPHQRMLDGHLRHRARRLAGSWAWMRVADRLIANGYRVFVSTR